MMPLFMKKKRTNDNDHMSPRDNSYTALADRIFDVSLRLTNEGGALMASSMQMPRYSAYTVQSATNMGTWLYEYATMLLREKMRNKFSDEYDFEIEDNEMVEAFAKKLMVPPVGLLKIIDRANIDEWESQKDNLRSVGVDIDQYVHEVEEIIESF